MRSSSRSIWGAVGLSCLLGLGCATEGPNVHELSPAEIAAEAEEAEPSWYNQPYIRSLFGDLPRTETVYVTSPESIKQLIAKGEHLTRRVAACGACHGETAGEPNAPLSGGRPMKDSFGSVIAPNITPSRTTGIGGWNVFALMRAIRAAVDNKGRPLSLDLHAGYRWMSDEDAKAVSLYLLSQAPVEKAVERRRLGGFERNEWGIFPQHRELAGYVPHPMEGSTAQFGGYVAKHVAACANCHTQGGMRGNELLFSGAKRGFGIGSVLRSLAALVSPFESSVVDESSSRALLSPEGQALVSKRRIASEKEELDIDRLYADALSEGRFPIIGPSIRGKSGLQSWSEEEIIGYLSTGKAPDGELRERRFCPWPFYSGMKEETKRAVARYLKTL